MPDELPVDKPVHIPRTNYPQSFYPASPVLPPREEYPDTDAIHLLDYWRVLLARRWTVIAIFVTFAVVTLIATLKETPIYEATTTIQIDRENPNVLSFKDVYQVESATDD